MAAASGGPWQTSSAPYLDVYYATSLRPGGHRPAMGAGGKGTDCMHYCLPGPIDDWARLLMAFWT